MSVMLTWFLIGFVSAFVLTTLVLVILFNRVIRESWSKMW